MYMHNIKLFDKYEKKKNGKANAGSESMQRWYGHGIEKCAMLLMKSRKW